MSSPSLMRNMQMIDVGVLGLVLAFGMKFSLLYIHNETNNRPTKV